MDEQVLSEKTALITGGSTEIAAAVALALAQAGTRVCLTGQQQDMLELAARQLSENGQSCLTIPSNLDSLESAESVLDQVAGLLGKLDFLVLVSPFWGGGPIHSHAVKTWDLVLSANLREPFLMSRAVLPRFREQGHGEILAIASDSAVGIYPHDGAYAVALHGLVAMLDLIRLENQEFGVRTHLLCPGVAISSEFDAEGHPALMPRHVADWVVWLLSRPAHLRSNGPIVV